MTKFCFKFCLRVMPSPNWGGPLCLGSGFKVQDHSLLLRSSTNFVGCSYICIYIYIKMFWRVSFEAGSEIQKQFSYRHMSATDDPSFSRRLSVALSGYPKAHGLRMHNYINCIDPQRITLSTKWSLIFSRDLAPREALSFPNCSQSAEHLYISLLVSPSRN